MIRLSKRLAGITRFAATSEHAKFNTQGVLIRETTEGFNLVATNGRVFGLVRCQDGNLPKTDRLEWVHSDASEIVLYTQDFERVLRAAGEIKWKGHDCAEMVLTKHGAVTTYGNAMETLLPLDGRFPDVERLIRDGNTGLLSVAVELNTLLGVLQGVKALLSDGEETTKRVTLHFRGDNRPFVVQAGDGDIQFEGMMVPLIAEPRPRLHKPEPQPEATPEPVPEEAGAA